MISSAFQYHVIVDRTSATTGRPLVSLTVLQTNDVVEANAEVIKRRAAWEASPSLKRRNSVRIQTFPPRSN